MSTHSGTMIDMSDVASALERMNKGRADSDNSLVSWGSQGTSVPTPPYVSPHQRSSTSSSSSSSSDSSSSSSSGSGATSPCSNAGCGNRFGNGLSASSGRGSVRWSDECGGELVTQVGTTTDFWEMMVFGDGSCACTSSSSCSASNSSSASSSSSSEAICDGCGELRRRPVGGGSSSSPPGELFRFVAELSRGVEATLIFPGLGGISKKRRPVILYTEDNGESICWIKTGGSGSSDPYRIRCKTLLEVKDKSGAGSSGERSAAAAAAGCGGELPVEGTVDSEFGGQEEGVGRGSENGGCGAAGACAGVRINLKWLPQPTWSKRSVKLVDVQTACPGMFTRGMQQLLSFNSDLQSY